MAYVWKNVTQYDFEEEKQTTSVEFVYLSYLILLNTL